MSELQRIVRVRPAYDCIMVQPCVHGSPQCIAKPGWCGRHVAELHMILRSQRAEVVLILGTGWNLPETPPAMRYSTVHRDLPSGLAVEFHSADPQYDGHEARDGECDRWGTCYTDHGYSMSDQPAELLVRQGTDAVWEWLEWAYRDRFGPPPVGPSDDDVTALAEVISEAELAGIEHGHYTLARVILDAGYRRVVSTGG